MPEKTSLNIVNAKKKQAGYIDKVGDVGEDISIWRGTLVRISAYGGGRC
jgi:hypothetical protein